jgi:5-methylcytosine-specific restriction endonuclease McrBC regulatory subunit McrC
LPKYMRLDGRIEGESSTVIECKYKHLTGEGGEVDLARVASADVYQIVSYCVHSGINAALGLIVYPHTDSRRALQLHGSTSIFCGDGRRLPVNIISISLTSPVAEVLSSVENFLGDHMDRSG